MFTKLQIYKNHVFHGSPIEGLKRIEPKLATDTDTENIFNNDHAIFASCNFCLATIFSLVDIDRLTKNIKEYDWSVDWQKKNGVYEIVAELPAHWRREIEQISGFIYVLPKDSFTEADAIQLKSKISVIPVECFTVTLKDFYNLGGQTKWTTENIEHDKFHHL